MIVNRSNLTVTQRLAVCDWLTAAGVDPNTTYAVHVNRDGTFIAELIVYGDDGRPLIDPNDGSRILTRCEQVASPVPFPLPLPPEDGDA